MFICMRVYCLCVDTQTCLYIYIYIYTHTYIHTYIHIGLHDIYIHVTPVRGVTIKKEQRKNGTLLYIYIVYVSIYLYTQ